LTTTTAAFGQKRIYPEMDTFVGHARSGEERPFGSGAGLLLQKKKPGQVAPCPVFDFLKISALFEGAVNQLAFLESVRAHAKRTEGRAQQHHRRSTIGNRTTTGTSSETGVPCSILYLDVSRHFPVCLPLKARTFAALSHVPLPLVSLKTYNTRSIAGVLHTNFLIEASKSVFVPGSIIKGRFRRSERKSSNCPRNWRLTLTATDPPVHK